MTTQKADVARIEHKEADRVYSLNVGINKESYCETKKKTVSIQMPRPKKYRSISYLLSEETGKCVAEDARQTMQTSLRAPMNTQQRVPGNNQTPNNAVIALVISDVLPLSSFRNKSLSDRPPWRRCGAGGSLPQPPNTKLCY